MSANGYRVYLGGSKHVPKLDCGGGCTTLKLYTLKG